MCAGPCQVQKKVSHPLGAGVPDRYEPKVLCRADKVSPALKFQLPKSSSGAKAVSYHSPPKTSPSSMVHLYFSGFCGYSVLYIHILRFGAQEYQ